MSSPQLLSPQGRFSAFLISLSLARLESRGPHLKLHKLLPASCFRFGPKSKAAGMTGSWCLRLRVDGKPRQSPDPEDGQTFPGLSSAELKISAQRERRMEPKGRERVVGKAPACAKATERADGDRQEGGSCLTGRTPVLEPGRPSPCWEPLGQPPGSSSSGGKLA